MRGCDGEIYDNERPDPIFLCAFGYYDPYGLFDWPSLPQPLVDAAAGFGDGVSMGGTSWYRSWREIDGGVDKCSGLYRASDFAGSISAPIGRFAYIARVGQIGNAGVRTATQAIAASAERTAVKRYFRGPLARFFWDYKDEAWAAQRFARRGGDAFAQSVGKSNPGFNGLAGYGALNAVQNQYRNDEDCTCRR